MKSLATDIMDSKFNGCHMHYVLVLMLLLNYWSLVLPAPAQHKCSFKQTVNLVELLETDTNRTLHEYKKNNHCSNWTSDEIPNATIAGSNVAEKLQDIYAKNELFSLHLSKVEEYQKSLFPTESIVEPFLKSLSEVKTRLNDHLLTTVKCLIKTVDPSAPVPAPPAALNLSHQFFFEKKVYGCVVLHRLKVWENNVKKELDSMRHIKEAKYGKGKILNYEE